MVILVYGEDTYRSRDKLSELVTKFKEKFDQSGMNVDDFEYSKVDSDGVVLSAVSSPPFLSDRRMVIVRGLLSSVSKKADAEMWAEKLSGRGEDIIVVLYDELAVERAEKNKLYVALKEKDDVHEYVFGEMRENEALAWVKGRSSKEWPNDAARELVTRVGADTWRLANEVEKIVAASGDESISRDTVIENVAPKFDDAMFAFLDAVRAKNRRRAVELLFNELDRGTAPRQLIMMLGREVQLLAELRAYAALNGRSSGRDAARALKLHPFVVKKTLPRALEMPPEELRHMISAVLTAERRVKAHNIGSEEDLLKQLVIDLIV